MEFKSSTIEIIEELAGVVNEVNETHAAALVEEILATPAVFVAGEGRSGLVARAFAMRLIQIGIVAHVPGETTTPAMKAGELLITISGSGRTGITVHFGQQAKACGGRVAAVVADKSSALAGMADLLLVIPGKAKSGAGNISSQMPGTLFEQAALIILDTLVTVIAERKGQTHKDMARRHANLE